MDLEPITGVVMDLVQGLQAVLRILLATRRSIDNDGGDEEDVAMTQGCARNARLRTQRTAAHEHAGLRRLLLRNKRREEEMPSFLTHLGITVATFVGNSYLSILQNHS